MANIALPKIEQAARNLVEANFASEPTIEYAYLFPSDQQIRIIHVDPITIPIREGDEIAPFYFAPDVRGGIPFPSAIAVVTPEEVNHLPPPQGWGRWQDAQLIRR